MSIVELEAQLPKAARETRVPLACDGCELGDNRALRSVHGHPLHVLCASCLDNEVRLDPRGVRETRVPPPPAEAGYDDSDDVRSTLKAVMDAMGFRGGAFKLDDILTQIRQWRQVSSAETPAWQPIATAPKDREIILTDGYEVESARWSDDEHCWFSGLIFHPITHWMPLPAPPVSGSAPERTK